LCCTPASAELFSFALPSTLPPALVTPPSPHHQNTPFPCPCPACPWVLQKRKSIKKIRLQDPDDLDMDEEDLMDD